MGGGVESAGLIFRMSWGQKKHTDAILRAKYEETKAREGPSPDGRPLSTRNHPVRYVVQLGFSSKIVQHAASLSASGCTQ